MIKKIVWPEIACDGNVGTPFPGTGEVITWAEIQETRRKRWTGICEEYEASRGDFYRAWNWLQEHPVFFYLRRADEQIHEKTLVTNRGFYDGMEISVQKVCPETRAIEKHSTRNILTTVWVEVFPVQYLNMTNDVPRWHDWNLDNGADTFESAIVVTANGIWERYGNDRERMKELWTSTR